MIYYCTLIYGQIFMYVNMLSGLNKMYYVSNKATYCRRINVIFVLRHLRYQISTLVIANQYFQEEPKSVQGQGVVKCHLLMFLICFYRICVELWRRTCAGQRVRAGSPSACIALLCWDPDKGSPVRSCRCGRSHQIKGGKYPTFNQEVDVYKRQMYNHLCHNII